MPTLYPELPEALAAGRNALNTARAGTIGANVPRFVKDCDLAAGGALRLTLGDPDDTEFKPSVTCEVCEDDVRVMTELKEVCEAKLAETNALAADWGTLVPIAMQFLVAAITAWLKRRAGG